VVDAEGVSVRGAVGGGAWRQGARPQRSALPAAAPLRRRPRRANLFHPAPNQRLENEINFFSYKKIINFSRGAPIGGGGEKQWRRALHSGQEISVVPPVVIFYLFP